MSEKLINRTWAAVDSDALGEGVIAGYVNLRHADAIVAVNRPRYGLAAIFGSWPGAEGQPKVFMLPDWNGRSAAGDLRKDLTELVRAVHPAPEPTPESGD